MTPIHSSRKSGCRRRANAALSAFEMAALRNLSDSLACLVSSQASLTKRCAVEARFARWYHDLQSQSLACGPVYQVMCDAVPFKAIDRRFRRRHGWSRDTVRRALIMWLAVATPAAPRGREKLPCESTLMHQAKAMHFTNEPRTGVSGAEGCVRNDV